EAGSLGAHEVFQGRFLYSKNYQWMAWNTTWNTEYHGSCWTLSDRDDAESPVFAGFQAQKKTSEDVFRWLFGGAGGI
ncbi:hypothetical protein, partial [Pseudomonas aeruginosa]|uniref:hypothetical protein n=1 Tax=Pseudomonas aeruginosa TaxID=287 RepID=UPI0019690444